jgi:hypothetical protein
MAGGRVRIQLGLLLSLKIRRNGELLFGEAVHVHGKLVSFLAEFMGGEVIRLAVRGGSGCVGVGG